MWAEWNAGHMECKTYHMGRDEQHMWCDEYHISRDEHVYGGDEHGTTWVVMSKRSGINPLSAVASSAT